MADMSRITTIGVCETQPVTAAGIRALVSSHADLKFLWTAESLDEALRLLRQQPPSLVLVDKAMGVNAIMRWMLELRSAPALAVVIWGSSLTEAEALRFVQSGARGVIRKVASTEAFIACLRAAASGATWIEDIIFRAAARPYRNGRSNLTPREAQIYALVEQGLTNNEIARELGIRPGTVKIHLKHLYEKTGIRSRYRLALSSLKEKGLLSMTA